MNPIIPARDCISVGLIFCNISAICAGLFNIPAALAALRPCPPLSLGGVEEEEEELGAAVEVEDVDEGAGGASSCTGSFIISRNNA